MCVCVLLKFTLSCSSHSITVFSSFTTHHLRLSTTLSSQRSPYPHYYQYPAQTSTRILPPFSNHDLRPRRSEPCELPVEELVVGQPSS